MRIDIYSSGGAARVAEREYHLGGPALRAADSADVGGVLTEAADRAAARAQMFAGCRMLAAYREIADERIAFQSREPARLESLWRQLASRDTASPKLWMDAYLAGFARAGCAQRIGRIVNAKGCTRQN